MNNNINNNNKLVLIRHGESTWNKSNKFTGWTDIDLTESGIKEAHTAGAILKKEGYDFDICYTSVLKRAIHSLNDTLDILDRNFLPVIKDWHLNERHYGALQGFNKKETQLKYGDEITKLWRRSYKVRPPALNKNDERNPANQEMYRNVDKRLLPLTESLEDTYNRIVPYYKDVILKDLKNGKHILIVSHANSLRALFKYLDNIDDEKIIDLYIPTGIPIVYEFNNDFSVKKHYYLGDLNEIQHKLENMEYHDLKKKN
jgi:2,3-bisphosphoglycerate-dependent phosphoglycerate mutase